MSPDLLTAAEVAATLRVHASTVSRLIAAGELAAVRVGRRTHVAASDLGAYIGRQRSAGSAAPAATECAAAEEVWSFEDFKARELAEQRNGHAARPSTGGTKKAARR